MKIASPAYSGTIGTEPSIKRIFEMAYCVPCRLCGYTEASHHPPFRKNAKACKKYVPLSPTEVENLYKKRDEGMPWWKILPPLRTFPIAVK